MAGLTKKSVYQSIAKEVEKQMIADANENDTRNIKVFGEDKIGFKFSNFKCDCEKYGKYANYAKAVARFMYETAHIHISKTGISRPIVIKRTKGSTGSSLDSDNLYKFVNDNIIYTIL